MPFVDVSLVDKFDHLKLVTKSLKESKDQILAYLREICKLGRDARIDIFSADNSSFEVNPDITERNNYIEFWDNNDLIYLTFENFEDFDLNDDKNYDNIGSTSFCFNVEEVRMMLDLDFKIALTLHFSSCRSIEKATIKQLKELYPAYFQKEEGKI